ncbi:MAG: hypothetical protein HYV99_00215 [Betaproteobacteria bacterium]|nr:hypothetical protein [Betaproteobacteria bacterium]
MAQGTMDNAARRHYRHIEVHPVSGALGAARQATVFAHEIARIRFISRPYRGILPS